MRSINIHIEMGRIFVEELTTSALNVNISNIG